MFTVLALHGSNQREDWLQDYVEEITPDLPHRLPRGTEMDGAGFTFFKRRADRSIDPATILPLASKSLQPDGCVGPLADGQFLAVGFSSGAIFSTALLSLAPDLFAGAILLRPEPISEQFAFPDLSGKPVLIISGLSDERRKPGDAPRVAEQLAAAGAAVTHHALESGHGWAPDKADTVLAQAWLKGAFGYVPPEHSIP